MISPKYVEKNIIRAKVKGKWVYFWFNLSELVILKAIDQD